MITECPDILPPLPPGAPGVERRRSVAAPPAPQTTPPAVKATVTPRTAAGADETAERRNVCVLFADISGFTSLSERMDPETVREIANEILQGFAAEVERYGGTVDKFLGDAVMALFGAPIAHEDDPVRAIQTVLRMRDGLASFNRTHHERLGGDLQMSAGLHRGLVVTGTVGSGDAATYTVMGDAVNVASRLQSEAPPGEIYLSEEMAKWAREDFRVESAGRLDLKGKSDLITAYRIHGRRVGESSAPAARRSAFCRELIGRDMERAIIAEFLNSSKTDGMHAIFLAGEAGMGKSRLVEEAVAIATGAGIETLVMRGRCFSFEQARPYHPYIHLL